MIRVEIGSIEELCAAAKEETTLLTAGDIKYIEGLSSAKRRREVTAWRALLRRVLRGIESDTYIYKGDAERGEVVYSSIGAPKLSGVEGLHIGVSHSSRYIALAVADEPCGVDIEDCGRNFEYVSNRFTTTEEHEVVRAWIGDGNDNRYILPLIWSAKEALYKVSGLEGLNLIEDIKLHIDGELRGEVGGAKYRLHHKLHEECIIVYSERL